MRLLERVLASLNNTKQPPRKFLSHRLGLVLMLAGPMTFRNVSRYRVYPEKRFARWFAREVDWMELNHTAITPVVATEHEPALVMDASVIPKSGQHTYGVDRFWNGCAGRAETGVAIAVLAWLDVTANQADRLSVGHQRRHRSTPRRPPARRRRPGLRATCSNCVGPLSTSGWRR